MPHEIGGARHETLNRPYSLPATDAPPGSGVSGVYIFSGSVTPSSSLTPVVEPEISLSVSGSYSYTQPFLLAGGYTLAVACASTATSGTTTVTFLPAAGMTATVTANQTAIVNF